MTKTRWLTIGTAASLAVVGIAWAAGIFSGEPAEDPEVAEIKDQMRQFRDDSESQMTPDQRRQAGEAMREKVESLSEEQRTQLMQGMREEFVRRMEQRIDAYFALPPEERDAELDRQIDEMEERRREMEERRREREPSGRPEGGRRFGSGRSPRPQPTREERLERMNRRLENTTPEQRAKFFQYINDIRERRRERGLPDMPRGPGGPRGPRGPSGPR